jgi:hypothetical protein
MEVKKELKIQSGNERNNSKDKHSSIKQNAMGTLTHGVGVLHLVQYWIQPKASSESFAKCWLEAHIWGQNPYVQMIIFKYKI